MPASHSREGSGFNGKATYHKLDHKILVSNASGYLLLPILPNVMQRI